MTDQPDQAAPENETPAQKALRLKKAKIAAQPQQARGGRAQAERQAAAHSFAKSKPWMSR